MLVRKVEKVQVFTKYLEELRNKQTEINNTVSTVEGIHSRMTQAE